ncbi:MAG: hydroxysqualene dehydroxylase HpnE [Burkholderiaceae bacterium]|nr:hydroxysqualene dehydroxylase HpnE [Burkholderiaceae bacterium]
MTASIAPVAVVGAGWAGIAAAVELARGGYAPIVFDSAPAPGGRARALPITLAGAGLELDNGQHLMLGAYSACLDLIETVRAGAPAAMRRVRLRLESTDGLRLVPWNLPAPYHLAAGLLAARAMTIRERLALARMLLRLRRAGWQARPGETVTQMLERLGQPASLRRRLWDPLAIAALNTDSNQACAQTFANVLRDSLGAPRAASDFVLAEPDLTRLLPEPAGRWLVAHDATLHMRTTVRAMEPGDDGWVLETTRGAFAARAVVLALPPYAATRLLDRSARAAQSHLPTFDALERFRYDSIATVYLAWKPGQPVSLPRWIMLEERPEDRGWGQWLFDRGERSGSRIAAVVVSARGRHDAISPLHLAQGIARQVRAQLATPEVADARTVVDKRATFRCTPDRPRLRPDAFIAAELLAGRPGTPYARLALAGDYAHPRYPATLESAVRSGIEAARLVMR